MSHACILYDRQPSVPHAVRAIPSAPAGDGGRIQSTRFSALRIREWNGGPWVVFTVVAQVQWSLAAAGVAPIILREARLNLRQLTIGLRRTFGDSR
jgi:hypothetical protein